MTFEPVLLSDKKGIKELSVMATEILREHYDPIVGRLQNDYMLEKFQSEQSLEEQIRHGYKYFFVNSSDKRIGFIAFYPKSDCMYLSKFYLYKHERGKGHARKMLDFVVDNTRQAGLSSIELNANKRNNTCLIYEKMGFKKIRSEKNDIGSGYYMDDYVFSLNI